MVSHTPHQTNVSHRIPGYQHIRVSYIKRNILRHTSHLKYQQSSINTSNTVTYFVPGIEHQTSNTEQNVNNQASTPQYSNTAYQIPHTTQHTSNITHQASNIKTRKTSNIINRALNMKKNKAKHQSITTYHNFIRPNENGLAATSEASRVKSALTASITKDDPVYTKRVNVT